jgi:hypothetical protein
MNAGHNVLKLSDPAVKGQTYLASRSEEQQQHEGQADILYGIAIHYHYVIQLSRWHAA